MKLLWLNTPIKAAWVLRESIDRLLFFKGFSITDQASLRLSRVEITQWVILGTISVKAVLRVECLRVVFSRASNF